MIPDGKTDAGDNARKANVDKRRTVRSEDHGLGTLCDISE